MPSKLVWWGAGRPAWLAETGEGGIVSVPGSDFETLLDEANSARAVLLSADSAEFAGAVALLKAAHVPVAAIGSDPVHLLAAGLPKHRLIQNARHLEEELAALALQRSPFRFLVDGSSQGRINGRVISGRPEAGLRVALLPDGVASTIVACHRDAASGTSALSVEPPLIAQAGSLVAEANDRPEVTDQVAAHVLWLDAGEAMLPGRTYRLALAGQKATATITALKYRLKPGTQEHIAARSLARGEIGYCNLSFDRPLAVEPAVRRTNLGSLALSDASSGRPLARGFVEFGLRRATNVHWQALSVDRAARATLNGQHPCCLWFTGLSGSGKSTVASLLERRLHGLGRHTYVLDGDNVRHGLNRDLGFTDADRVENIRRVAEVAKLMADAGLIVLVSFISPFKAERRLARALFKDGEFLEVFLDTPIEVCEARDPKGLYKKARAGLIKNFTGIDSAYEPPDHPELRLEAGKKAAGILVEEILTELTRRRLVPSTG